MVLDYVFVQEEAVGGVVAWLRASYHHLRQTYPWLGASQ